MGAVNNIVRPSQIVRQLLFEEGICQPEPSLPWWCTTAKMPDGDMVPDDIVSIVDKEDAPVGRYLSDASYRLDPHVFIAVRAVGLPKSYDKIRELTDCLDVVFKRVVEYRDERYCIENTKRTTMIQLRGQDATTRRYIQTVEYNLHFV